MPRTVNGTGHAREVVKLPDVKKPKHYKEPVYELPKKKEKPKPKGMSKAEQKRRGREAAAAATARRSLARKKARFDRKK